MFAITKFKVPPLREVSPSSTLDHVYSELKHAVMAGEFQPGQPMRLEELATAFGTSHMPVREALNRLVVAGALEQAPRRSVRIPRLTEKQIHDLLAVRLVNEGQAVEWAAKFCTSADIAKLATLNSKLDELENSEEFDVRQYLKFNQSFHFTLYALSQNEILLKTIEILWLQSGPLLHLLTAGMSLQHGHKRHSEVVACLAAGDGVGASEALKNDIREAYAKMLTIIEKGWPERT
ncbi:GntR family transcriptional regulator [Sinorhizobium sp. 7-81]|uniref:GntR family transcriptional regulator n=1 Tax=Sinorhizobium sp. 8-89 TaxID=3049089 RepID=UPI0024C27E40|nr:GntR family transcriptional regulator [Sinorhizobium sp. 8-89]MDK1494222.1 GntR family transcriptional regulator [Sinorhizobium sp. 8-89]